MNKLDFDKIQGNGNDEIASTGHELVQAFNGNFDLVKAAIENLDQRLFHDLSVTSMAELDNLRSGSYRILLTIQSGTEQFYLFCTIDPDGLTIRQTQISDSIYIRTFFGNKWTKWISYQETFLKSAFGDSEIEAVSQKFFTEQIHSIQGDIEVALSKATLFNNLGVITNLSDLNGVGKPGYYTYSKRLNGHETINGLLIVSRVGFGGAATTLQIRYELGVSYLREFDVVSVAWKEWEEISNIDSIMLDQLDTLTDPLSTISSYTVYYQNQKIGILQCFTNAQADVITQCLEANWDIDVSGHLLPDYNVTELRSLVRTYNISSVDIANEIPLHTWGRWKYNQKVITLSGGVLIE